MQPAPESFAEEPIFYRDGESLVPTGFARGPWHTDGQHGSAMLGLLARAVDLHPMQRPMQVTRLTVEFLRAAPLSPIQVPTKLRRGGKTMEIVEAEIVAGGEVYARASAMRFRLGDYPIAEEPPRYGGRTPIRLPNAEEVPCPDGLGSIGEDAFHMMLEMRPDLGDEGPAIWYRMRAPLVEGEPLSPIVRAAVVADWAYAVPFVHHALMGEDLPEELSFSAINPDTTLNLHRPVEGEWVGLDSHVHYGEIGAGTALAWLTDERGPVGHASQSILIREAAKMSAAEHRRSGH